MITVCLILGAVALLAIVLCLWMYRDAVWARSQCQSLLDCLGGRDEDKAGSGKNRVSK
jgi:hypothetical protein